MATEILIGQVLQTTFPSQYGKWRNPTNPLVTLKPGTIRVRTRGSSTQASNEVWAIPANPHYHQVPIYGEQVLLMTHADGDGFIFSKQKYYYISLLNSHGFPNNSKLPFLQDARVSGRNYMPSPISLTFPGIKPIQPTFLEKDIIALQPYTGDVLHQDRWGSAIRMSSTHLIMLPYKKKPFFKGVIPHAPFMAITCGVDDAMKGSSKSKHYAAEDPDKDKSWIYLTSSQKIEKFKPAQTKLGDGVDPLAIYLKPQILMGSDRIMINAKKDEVILVGKKDVKIATPKWQADMDEFFTQMLKLIDEVIKQNKNLEAAHKEYGAIAQANATSIHPTPVGPSGPPVNAGAFVKSKGKSVSNAATTKQIRKKIEAIQKKIKKMKQ